MCLVMRGQARKDTQRPTKKSTRGRKKTRVAATEDEKSGKSGKEDVGVETSKGAGSMDDLG